MNNSSYVLGVDLGIGDARVGIFDLKCSPIVLSSEKISLFTPSSGRAEQDANQWWSALCKACKQAIETSGINPADIKGMSVDTTCCTVLISGDDMERNYADVSNVPITVPKVTEGPCLGSAILGAVAGGIYPDIQTAAKNMTSVDYVIQPNAEQNEKYQFYYKKYKEFYELAKDWMHQVTMYNSNK